MLVAQSFEDEIIDANELNESKSALFEKKNDPKAPDIDRSEIRFSVERQREAITKLFALYEVGSKFPDKPDAINAVFKCQQKMIISREELFEIYPGVTEKNIEIAKDTTVLLKIYLINANESIYRETCEIVLKFLKEAERYYKAHKLDGDLQNFCPFFIFSGLTCWMPGEVITEVLEFILDSNSQNSEELKKVATTFRAAFYIGIAKLIMAEQPLRYRPSILNAKVSK